MHVAVAIVGFRNPDDVQRCLTFLDRSEHADFEVVICENGGMAAAEALRETLPDVLSRGQRVAIVPSARNLGYAGGVNICLAHAPDADAWWILNPDTAPEPEALSAMIERLERGDVDAVGCTIELSSGVIQCYGGRWQAWLGRAVSMGHGRNPDAPIDAERIERRQNFLNGASMLVSRRFVSVAGPLQEDYFLYCEETEWCLRALRKGLSLGFAPRGRIVHVCGTTTGSGAEYRLRPRLPIYLSARNAILLTRDLYPARLPIVGVSCAVMQALRFAKRRAWRQLFYAMAGIVAGLRNERGAPAWLTV